MLALPRRAIDDRNAVRLGVASRAPAEPAGQPDKMGVTQGFVRFRQSSPPHGETARTMPRPEIAIQNDAIHAIVAAVKQLSIEFAQSVCHGPFSRGDAERRIHHTQHTAYSGHFVKCGAVSTRRNCPAGATFPQPCLGEKRRFLTTRLRRVHFRSSFGHPPARVSPELFIRRSPPRLFTAATRTGLRPAPESRSRGAVPHHSRSFTIRCQFIANSFRASAAHSRRKTSRRMRRARTLATRPARPPPEPHAAARAKDRPRHARSRTRSR